MSSPLHNKLLGTVIALVATVFEGEFRRALKRTPVLIHGLCRRKLHRFEEGEGIGASESGGGHELCRQGLQRSVEVPGQPSSANHAYLKNPVWWVGTGMSKSSRLVSCCYLLTELAFRWYRPRSGALRARGEVRRLTVVGRRAELRRAPLRVPG